MTQRSFFLQSFSTGINSNAYDDVKDDSDDYNYYS